MIYLFDKDEKLFKIINKPALKTVLQKYALTTEQYVSDRLTVEMKSLDTDELEKVEYMAIQTIEDAHTFHYFYVAQKYTEQLTTLIGVQSGIEELRKTPVWDKRPKNAFAKNVINDLLKGTNWQARFVGETTQRSTSFYYISVFEALKKVCKVWDLEMQFFVEMNGNKIGARYIDFKRKIGSAVGKRVVYGHNALQILQEVERTNLFTALIGRGKGEQVSSAEESNKKTDGYGRKITFENLVWDVAKGNPVNKPKGQRFVELPEMTKVYGIKNTDGSIRPKIGFVDFQEEEDPGVLLERTYKALVDTARPQLTLKTTSAYLRGVKVGDTIRVVRHDKKLDYDTRIFEITFNRLNNESTDIKLGDRIGESNEAKAQTIAEKVVDDFVSNEFSDFVQKLPDFLPSPNGFNNNWYGAEDPTVKYPGKVLINDIWFKPDPEHEGHKIMLRWTGEVWDEILRSYDKELLTKRISEEIANFDKTFQSVNEQNKEKIDAILQSSGASSLLAQEAKRIGLDSVAKLEEFKRQATSAQTALSGDLDVLKRTVASEVNQASEHRRTTTEALSRMTGQMNGFATKSEVAQGIDGLTETFAKMRVGGTNLLKGSKGPFMPDRKPANFDNNILYVGNTSIYMEQGQEYIISAKTDGNFTAHHDGVKESDNVVLWIMDKDVRNYQIVSDLKTGTTGTKIVWNKPTGIYHLRVNTYHKEAVKSVWDVKIEKGNVATDWSPAIEDTDGLITEAKANFERTAQGLRTDLSAIQDYVNKDGQRKEELQRYTREESAKQATAVRELVARDFVGKSTYQEDVRAIERKFEGITNPQNGSIATQIATYKNAVDGRFANITSLLSGKANQTDFQRVQETSQLYERILGNTENGIADKVARMALTNQLFQVEVGKYASQGGPNLIKNSGNPQDSKNWGYWEIGQNPAIRVGTHDFFFKNKRNLFYVNNKTRDIVPASTIRFPLKRNTVYSVALTVFNTWNMKGATIYFLGKKAGESQSFTRIETLVDNTKFSSDEAVRKNYTFNSGECDEGFIRIDNNGTTDSDVAILLFGDVDVYEGTSTRPWQPSPEDTDEAIRTVQSQLAGSWGVHNKNSVNEIIAGFNLAGRNAGIKAETIRLEGNTLADKLTAIDGYFKRLFVGEGTFATLNTDILRANSITADKLVFNEALANRLVSNEIITSKLVASRAFVNALKAVTIDASRIVTGTLKGDRIYGGTIRGTEINGTTITGNSRITIGDNGFLRPTQEGGLQINVPETFNASKGIGVQLFGRNFGQIPKGMFIYNSPNWNGGNLIGESVADTLLTVKGLTSLCNLYRGQPMSGLPINSNFRYGDPVGNLYRISFIAWDPRHGQMFVNDGSDTDGSWWFKPDASSSDKRLKVNIQDTNFEATDFVKKLEFKQFDWKPDKFGYKKPYTNVGLIAQDVEKLDSSLVYSQGENLALDDFRLGNIALKAIQELSQRIETLERKLA